MGNATFEPRSPTVTALYKRIAKNNSPMEHISLSRNGFAALVPKAGKLTISIYNFHRSIKPLARIVEGGEAVIMRDYFRESELIPWLNELAVLTAQFEVSPGDHVHYGVKGLEQVTESFASTCEPSPLAEKFNQIVRDGVLRHPDDPSPLTDVNLSDVLDTSHKIALECGFPVPPRNRLGRNHAESVSDEPGTTKVEGLGPDTKVLRTCLKLCDPHRQ